jgi:osomolarity two-component system, sensor histidine kinase SLN1
LELKGDNLVTIAVLKSVQINQTINFLYQQVFSITTRVMIQRALVNYYAENQPPDTQFDGAYPDLQTAIGTESQILEGRIYTNNFTWLPNLTVTDVSYGFPDSLFPTGVPVTPSGINQTANEGTLLGPVEVPATPGSFALSLTIPIINNNVSSQPYVLGYMSAIVSASGIQRAVNDSTGMGQTGQLLVVAQNGSHYDVVLPPSRTPDVFDEDFTKGQYPAVDMAFENRSGAGYLINTNNARGAPVSVGYNV